MGVATLHESMIDDKEHARFQQASKAHLCERVARGVARHWALNARGSEPRAIGPGPLGTGLCFRDAPEIPGSQPNQLIANAIILGRSKSGRVPPKPRQGRTGEMEEPHPFVNLVEKWSLRIRGKPVL